MVFQWGALAELKEEPNQKAWGEVVTAGEPSSTWVSSRFVICVSSAGIGFGLGGFEVTVARYELTLTPRLTKSTQPECATGMHAAGKDVHFHIYEAKQHDARHGPHTFYPGDLAHCCGHDLCPRLNTSATSVWLCEGQSRVEALQGTFWEGPAVKGKCGTQGAQVTRQ